jgi:hypothetical protein
LTAFARPDVRIVVSDPDHRVVVWDRIVFELWRGTATLSGAQRMIATCQELLARGGASFFVILEATSPPPSEPVRALLAQWSRETVPKMESAIVVAEGGGFRAAIVRGVCLALTLLAPHRVPFTFVATVEEGLARLTSSSPHRRDRHQLQAVLQELRR